MGALSERVSNIRDAQSKKISIPEWDDMEIEVRSLTLAERNRITVATRKKGGETDVDKYYSAIIIATCWDPETGEKAFDASDIRMLQGKSGAALDRLAKAAMRLSGLLDDEDEDSTEDGEDLDDVVNEAGKASSSSESSEPGF